MFTKSNKTSEKKIHENLFITFQIVSYIPIDKEREFNKCSTGMHLKPNTIISYAQLVLPVKK
jgi:hypothetical protein